MASPYMANVIDLAMNASIGHVHYVIDCKNITQHSGYLGEIRTLNGDVMHNEYTQNHFTLAYGITIII